MENIRQNSEFFGEIDERRATQTDYLGILCRQEEPVEEVASHIGFRTLHAEFRIPVRRRDFLYGYKTTQTGHLD